LAQIATVFILLVVYFLAHIHSHNLHAKEYLVKKVIDGDTIQLDTGETVRYIGIDAPEVLRKKGGAEYYAREAARYNKKLVIMRNVRLEFDVVKKDQHGRLLAYVFVKNTFVNAELVKHGYAKADIKPPNTKYQDILLANQKKVMEEHKGLWQEIKRDTESVYIGNKRIYKLHRPICPLVKKISDKHRIIFRSRMDAIKIGFSLCKKCNP
jgi:micrococcal nuclease